MNYYVPSYSSFFNTQISRSSSRVEEDANGYYIQLDAPGIKLEDLKISTEGRYLSIEGERKGRFKETLSKSFSLPDDVELDKIEAQLKDGVLELALPKKEQVKPKTIAVKEGKDSFFQNLLGQKNGQQEEEKTCE
jgi:HSP20 family molecular chaperone IbpA